MNNYRMPRLHEWDPGSGAGKLMALAGSSLDRVGPQGAKLIIYDPHVGLGYCNMVLSAMKKYLT